MPTHVYAIKEPKFNITFRHRHDTSYIENNKNNFVQLLFLLQGMFLSMVDVCSTRNTN